MHRSRSILAVLLFVSSLGFVNEVFSSEEIASMAMKTETSAALQSSQPTNVLGQIAIALAGGSGGMRALRGVQSEDAQKDRLETPLPGMDCGIDRILSYLSCYSAPIIEKKEAENAFMQLVDAVRAGLPSASWRPVRVVPTIGSIQTISYQDWESGAQIDIELLVRPTLEAEHSYVISFYGWPGFEK